jgi:AcrR family transcriptional regulator
MEGHSSRRSAGRARDASIDERILAVAQQHLSAHGYERMSLTAVAQEAGTTRQALYRRWPGKTELAAAALGALEDDTQPEPGGDPFAALVAELTDFQHAVSQPGRMSLVGTMLQDTTDPDVRARYQARIIAPRRHRLRRILETARRQGLIDDDADTEIAVTLGTGSWYARALAGHPPPERWPERTATIIWRALGGSTDVGQDQSDRQ